MKGDCAGPRSQPGKLVKLGFRWLMALIVLNWDTCYHTLLLGLIQRGSTHKWSPWGCDHEDALHEYFFPADSSGFQSDYQRPARENHMHEEG